MKNQWIHFFSGTLTVKATGQGPEKLINSLVQNRISVWNVKWRSPEELTFCIGLSDAKKLRPYVRKHRCKISFTKRTGFPFFVRKMVRNGGFLAGGIMFMAVIFLLSNMIWKIEIEGAKPATEYKIEKALKELGVKRGRLQFLTETPESIQHHLTNKIDEITWVGVELSGTAYHLRVVEKSEPEKKEKLRPRNLVAKKKAVIVDMFVEEGEPKVDIYDLVQPGQLLVSGKIGKDGETKLVPAKGEVYGEIWYKSEVILPMESRFQVFNGNEARSYSLKVSNVFIPLWVKGKTEFKNFETESSEREFRFLNWRLPVTFVTEIHRESEIVTRKYSDQEAYKVAREMARRDLQNRLPEDAVIKDEKILHLSRRNGKVYLKILFHVYEDIAKEQPIIQGESE